MGGGLRTRGRLLGRQALYLLSYAHSIFNFLKRTLERERGFEPLSPAWRADTLASVLLPHRKIDDYLFILLFRHKRGTAFSRNPHMSNKIAT